MYTHVEKRQDALLLPPAAQKQNPMLSAWSFVQSAVNRHACIHHIFEAQAAQTPHAVALICQEQSLTYGELNCRANQLAHLLQKIGVGPEICVAVCMERSLELIVALLGILKAGGVYVPLDPAYPQDRLQYMLADTQAPVVLTQERLRGQLPTIDSAQIQVIALDSSWQAIVAECEHTPVATVAADNLAYVIYTSGSTGKPKGVLVPHRGLCNVVDAQIETFDIRPESRIIQFSSISFDASIFEMVMALCMGASLYLAPREMLLPGPDLVQLLREQSITHITIPPSSLTALPSTDLPALETVIVAGEACPSALVAQWAPGRMFFNAYGPTETTIWATTAHCVADGSHPHIGREILNTQCYILDQHLQPVLPGDVGELYVAGIGVTRGYRNRPDLTADRFVPNPFSAEPGSRLYKTGDLARHLPNGAIDYLGRADQQVKIRGFRIELSEIEAVLAQHPAVREAIAMARQDVPGDVRLVAYVVGEPRTASYEPTALKSAELRRWVQERLPEYMVPAAVVALDTLPLTPNGKVDRKALPAPDMCHFAETTFVAPRTATEAVVASIWADVLHLDQVGVLDNFFALGGHSLLAGQVLVRLRDAFQSNVSMQMLFEHATVESLAVAISALVGGETIADERAEMYRDRQMYACSARHSAGTIVTSEFDVQRPASGQLPLSFAQQRLWMVERLDPGNLSYLVPLALRLIGPLNIDALEQSFNEIVRRHEALRTVFRVIDEQPVQVVLPELHIPLAIIDLQELDPAEQAQGVQQLALMEAQRAFNLVQGPLLRTTLLRLTAEEHVLLLTMHHIVIDDWSLSIFWRELSACYTAHVTGQPARLGELTAQYPDVALWQREWLQGIVLAEQIAYWAQQLNGCAAVLNLPTDRPRPAKQTFNGARETIVLPQALGRTLSDLSQREGATLFMTLLAAFQVLMQRYSRQNDFVVGTPICNRRRREFEDLIGFFVNTLALRADLSGNPSFRELLARVRETALGAYMNQDLPFEQMVELVQPERDPSRNPLFQVMFALQNSPHEVVQLQGVTAELLPQTSVAAQFDLFLEMIPVQDGLLTSFEYNTDLFDAATIKRMLSQFQTLLERVATTPDLPISALPILPAAEQHQILVEWNATQATYPAHWRLHDLVEAQVARTPHAVALVFEDQALTYQELNRRANQLAHHLRTLGVGPDTLVGICVERSLEMVIGLLGVLKAGGAYIPLDPAFPNERLALMVADAQPSVLLTQQHLLTDLPENNAQIICLDTDWPDIAQQPTYDLATTTDATNLAYVIYTSGSTGKPKGVQIQHRSAVNFLYSMREAPGLTEQDVLLSVTTLSFDIAVLELYLPLMVGAQIVLVSRETAADGSQLYAKLVNSGATVMQATPATWRMLIEAGWQNAGSLKVLCGGEALPSELARQILDRGATLWNLYGPTETTVWSTVAEVTLHDATISMGHPIANTQIYILDKQLNPVPIGVPGELYIGGDGLSRGYLHRPALTAERFIPNPFSATPGERIYYTGDLARYLPNGRIEYLGRIDHQVKVRGFRIELGDIESAIRAHPAVQEAVVIAREDVPGDKRLVAYLVPDQHYEITDDLLAESQAEHIADWQQVYDDSYGQSADQSDETFDIAIWNSSYTGTPIPAAEMQEQVDQVVARVLAHQPQRVLEIGCGTGLLLFRIAPHCEYYLGTDFSATVLQSLAAQVEKRNLTQVQLLQRVADDLSGIDGEPFDVVLINSVVQYFPSADYLVQVLKQAVQYVRPGGCIMVGDLRSYPLLEAYHASVQAYQAAPMLSTAKLCERISSRVASEEELLIDPAFFQALQQQMPCISQVEVQLRRGQYENELTKFRYDVKLHVERDVTKVVAQQMNWQRDGLSLEHVRAILATQAPAVLQVQQVPNARVWQEVETLRLLASPERPATVRDLTVAAQTSAETPVEPEAIWALGAELGYTTEVGWAESDLGMLQVVFRRTPLTYGVNEMPTTWAKPWSAYANNPVYSKLCRKLVPQVRAALTEKLPEYMIPSAFVLMEALPLTPNGKIDRKALPAPNGIKYDDHQTFIAPRTPLETELAAMWADLFGIERVSINDDFFALGGHSLLATRLASQIKATFGVDLPLRTLFSAPTVAGCAQVVEAARQASAGQDETTDLLVDLIADTALDLSIRPEPREDWFTAAPNALFMTGATGFLGAFLLHELLQTTPADLYCLVRAKTSIDGMRRIQATLEQYGLWDKQFSGRIVPVVGDLGQPRFGLSEEEFALIAAKVDGIYHSGAMVSFIYPYAAMRSANVLGTQEVLRLACQGKMKPVHYISTVAVALTAEADANGRICEDATLGPVDSVDNGYVQTKWVAEHLMLAAKERGLPVSIYRPGRIAGHSATGASNPDDLVSRLIVGWIQQGGAPTIDTTENLTPVDYIAQAIVHLSLQRETVGKVFHLVNPQSIKFTELAQAINQAGFSVQIQPYAQWYANLFATAQSEHDNVLYPLLSFLSPLKTEETWVNFLSMPQFDCQNTIDGLANSSVVCPAFSAQQIELALAYFVKRGIFDLGAHHGAERAVAMVG